MEMNGVRIMGGNKPWKKLVDKGSGIKKEGSARGRRKSHPAHCKEKASGAIRYQHAHKLLQHKVFRKFLLFPISVTTTIYGISNELVLSNETRDKRQKTYADTIDLSEIESCCS
ncbi:hypothetical protein BOTCAL_0557g00040 [Botryotinia calthae]|uniref:Uncharacterized protein n=1 Tax=Botryotinia calthae TaxID=38488 RepID=A0A4Y8CLP5_9HELO|nr:hypothetical protein BOTCAL_0557g00040 [Botryotinia calthae]